MKQRVEIMFIPQKLINSSLVGMNAFNLYNCFKHGEIIWCYIIILPLALNLSCMIFLFITEFKIKKMKGGEEP